MNNVYVKSPEEEFNPFHDYLKIHKEKIDGLTSNEWRFHLKFEGHYEEY